MKIDPSFFNYKDALAVIQPGSSFSLYDHNVRAEVSNVEYIVDHHDHSHPQAKKYLIAHMGSVLTHLYYLLFPDQLKQIEIKTEAEKGYVDLFLEFTK